MDSLTQAALGAAVGTAVMGRTHPVWQAALSGALVGTLPDLDVFIDHGDAVRNMVLHRAETHALFWQLLATPVITGVFAMLAGSRAHYARWCLMVLLGLFTHSLLDAMTIYGTRLGLPFSDHPFGLGSLFIIDPLYTLPLLAGIGGALLLRPSHGLRWNHVGLILSTLYAGWSIAAQGIVTERVMASAAAKEIPTERILVTPTPFNTLLWRIVLINDDHYLEGFHSLLDPRTDGPANIRFDTFARGVELEPATREFASATMVREFSKGFYALSDDGRYAYVTDLRMGQHPYFPFTFAFARHASAPLHAITPTQVSPRIPLRPGLDWLSRRIRGDAIPPPRDDLLLGSTPATD